MKYIIRLNALIIALAILLGTIVSVSAANVNDSTVFLKQETSSTCTLSAAAMMLRRRAILDGNQEWTSITESNMRDTAWVPGKGARFNYTYNGISVTTRGLKNFSGDKKEYFISMLSTHPEGIVVYNQSKPHAVLLTDYDSTTGTFYCADPSTAAPYGRIRFLNSRIPGDTQDSKIKNINQIWYIKSGVTIPAVTEKNSQSGKWIVTVPANYKLLCYPDSTAAKNTKYLPAQQTSYPLSCESKATLSDGRIRYFFVDGNGLSLWFDYDANRMSATEIHPSQDATPKKYTVYFNPNGGYLSQSSKTVTAGSFVGSMPTPTRQGYKFLGWTTSQYSSGLLLRTGDEMYVNENLTLYALWEEEQKPSKNFNVILDDGSTCKSITVTNGGTYSGLTTPSREGYTFTGWYTQQNGGTKITSSTKVNLSGNQILYAQWLPVPTMRPTPHSHVRTNAAISPEHPHYTYYTCTCGEVFTDNEKNYVDSCLVCLGEKLAGAATSPETTRPTTPTTPSGHWERVTGASTAPSSSDTIRNLEERRVETSPSRTEYRYGGYATYDGNHECWCETYLRSKFGSAVLRYSDWSTSRYGVNGKNWTCGDCRGNHINVGRYGKNGRPIWPEYTLPGGMNYYWEESRTIPAEYRTEYTYEVWIPG